VSARIGGRSPEKLQTTLATVMRSTFARVIGEEFGNLNLRLVLADLLVIALPRLCFSRVRTAIYRLAGIEIGPRTSVLGRLTITGPGRIHKRLRIGADCVINAPLFLDLSAEIRIGDRVSVGHHSVFVTAQHEIGPPDFRAGVNIGRPIVVNDGSWIAAGSSILPGVTIGQSSIVASGAVVTRDVPSNALVGGVPARLIKTLTKAVIEEHLPVTASPPASSMKDRTG
jgi:maltose O-acetyltransferase